jgi:hypothetical protein
VFYPGLTVLLIIWGMNLKLETFEKQSRLWIDRFDTLALALHSTNDRLPCFGG